MSGKELRRIMEELNGEGEKIFDEIYRFPEELSEKQLRRAIDSYAEGVKPEEVVALIDFTVMGSGKKGYLFTKDRIYGSLLDRGPLPLEGLQSAVKVDLRNDSHCIALIWEDGTIWTMYGTCSSSGLKILPLLQRVAGCKQPEGRPEKRGEDFYKRCRTVLRREIRQIAEHCSEEDRTVQFAESREQEVLEGLIAGCKAQIKPEEIVAVHSELLGRGSFFTDRAYYSNHLVSLSLNEVYYDGLQRIATSPEDDSLTLLIYENGYIRGCRNKLRKEMKLDLKMIEKIAGVFRNIDTLADREDGLSFAEGFEEFTVRREKRQLEAYKNSVFVSSTFKDMHYERDAIHEKVLPALNKAGAEYGQIISFCDLRWGVNTGELDSEEGSKKVLSVCLNEIERCKPYMIVILGERYGWIPEPSTIANALEGHPDFALDELEKSVTALEIEFGALSDPGQLDRTFFYFREIDGNPSDVYRSEDAHRAEKLNKLKERIRKFAGRQLKSYRVSWDAEKECLVGLADFAQMVIRDIKGAMEEEWRLSAQESAFHRELRMHWELAEKKALQCSGRDALIRSYLEELEQGERMIVITGEAGSGKSTLMGVLSVIMRLSGADVLPIFCGYTTKSDTALEIVQSIVFFLRECLGEPEGGEEPDSEKEWLKLMNRLVGKYTKKGGRHAVLVIDAADQLLAGELRDSLRFLPERLTDRVRVVLSCLDGFPLSYEHHTLPLMGKEDKPDVIRGILSLHRRELEDVVISAIAEKPSSDHPLYMNLLIQQLLMMNKNDFDDIAGHGDGMSAISSHQLELIRKSADDLDGICREVIHSAAGRIGGGFVEKAMEYLAVSRHGLRESDLEGLLREEGILWNALDFSLFINYLRNMFLIRDDGRVDFSHKSFREGLCRDRKDEKKLHVKLWEWLKKLPEDDEVKVQEMLYHGIRGDKKKEFAADINTHEKENDFCRRAARELVIYSLADGGKWIEESLAGLEDIAVCQSYLRFLTYKVYLELLYCEAGGTLKETIYLAALKAAKQCAENLQTAESRRIIGEINRKLGRICELKGTGQDRKKALACYLEALAVDEELEKESSTPRGRRDLSNDCMRLGNFYLEEDGEQAEQYFERSMRLAEEVAAEDPSEGNRSHLAACYLNRTALYKIKKEWDTGLSCAEKGIALREDILWEHPDASGKESLALACWEAAYICQMNATPEYVEKAIPWLKKAAALWEELAEEDRSVENVLWLGRMYGALGACCKELNSELYAKEVVEYYKKAIPLLDEAYKAGEDTKWALAGVCREVSNVLRESGSASDFEQGKKWTERALQMYEEIARETESAEDYGAWLDTLVSYHNYVAGTAKALESAEQMIKILELLYEKTGDSQYKKKIQLAKIMRWGDKKACRAKG